ncbi:proton-coupled amino acid transporter 4-like [Spodoptera litura]|uniref:Proton-coupled amino acid transporter 4-like n=1 Tax=Spodoptera litura TaxID=69820 RepID=A0A9J7EI92_SPOLT|nr:proton-coupled amino acid transporter 4-like [Spodoptera litura]
MMQRYRIIVSMVHMLMYGLGGSLVVLHAAYMECGIFLAMSINLVLAALIGYCACILVWSAQKLYGRVERAILSYPDMLEATILLSPWNKLRKTAKGARYLLEFTLVMHLYGSCCVFVIMIARALKELVNGDHTISDAGEPPLKVYIISLMMPCVAISMVMDLKTLAPFALICNLYAFAVILVLLWYSFHNIVDSPGDRAPYKSVMGTFQFMSLCVFVLEPVSHSLAVENNMEDPTKFHYVVLGSMPIHTACMVTVGFIGYWYYAENCVSPITMHYPYSA